MTEHGLLDPYRTVVKPADLSTHARQKQTKKLPFDSEEALIVQITSRVLLFLRRA